MRAYLQCPIDYGGITTEYSKSHKAIDIGWSTEATKYCPIRSGWNGEIVENGGSATSVHGLYVAVYYGMLTINNETDYYWGRFQHIKSGSGLAKGTKVIRGQQIAIRGNSGKTSTGKSYGVHTHYVLYKGKLDPVGKYDHAVDPQSRTWLYAGQVIKASSMVALPVPVPVAKNENVHQMQVTSDYLRVRNNYGTSATILGYAMQGYYDVNEAQQANGYIWYNPETNMWMAITENYSIDLPVENVAELKKKIAELETDIAQKDIIIKESNATIAKQTDVIDDVKIAVGEV